MPIGAPRQVRFLESSTSFGKHYCTVAGAAELTALVPIPSQARKILRHALATCLSIGKRSFLLGADVVAGSLFIYLTARSTRRPLIRGTVVAILGALVGLIVVWLISDVRNVFGIALTAVVHAWVVLLLAGVFLAVSNLWASRWRHKKITAVSICSFLVAAAAAAGINIDFGAYRNLNDALGISPYSALPAARLSSQAGTMEAPLPETWRARDHTGMPRQGMVGTVSILNHLQVATSGRY